MTRRPGRALLIAEAPPRGAPRGAPALDGPSGDRLAGYAGLADRDELLRRFDCANLLDRWPGPCGKGTAWPAREARRAAACVPLTGSVVLLGRRVAAAFGYGAAAWGDWMVEGMGDALVAVLPHPSGIVRSWNNPAVRELAAGVLWEAEGLALESVGRLAPRG